MQLQEARCDCWNQQSSIVCFEFTSKAWFYLAVKLIQREIVVFNGGWVHLVFSLPLPTTIAWKALLRGFSVLRCKLHRSLALGAKACVKAFVPSGQCIGTACVNDHGKFAWEINFLIALTLNCDGISVHCINETAVVHHDRWIAVMLGELAWDMQLRCGISGAHTWYGLHEITYVLKLSFDQQWPVWR